MSEETIGTVAPEETKTVEIADQPAPEETKTVEIADQPAPEETLEEVLEEELEEQVYLPGGTVYFTENGNTIYSTREP